MTTVLGSLANLSRKSRETESILLYTYRLTLGLRKGYAHMRQSQNKPFDVFPVVLHNNVDKIVHSCYPLLANIRYLVGCSYHSRHGQAPHSLAFCSLVEYCTASSHRDYSGVLGMWFSFPLPFWLWDKCSWVPELMNNRNCQKCQSSYGGSRFNLIPTASSSPSNRARCSALFVASRIIKIRSLVCFY